MSKPVLEVTNLRITFRGRRRDVEAVRGCSIKLHPGEILGLVGESGSGKSQLSLACMGLTAESGDVSGSIQLAGIEIVGADRELIRGLRGDKIAMIFQNPMTALAVSCEAKVLIADEPTTALDVTTQKQVTDLLRRLVDELQMGLIFITHDMSVVSELADRVAVMRKGEIIEQGTIAEVMGHPQDDYTRLLLASVPMLGDQKSNPPCSGFTTQNARIEGAAFLQVRQLSKAYPTRRGVVHALKEVDFRLMAGECTALVGESGSGKTTLAMSLLQLLQPSSGQIYFEGKEISRVERKALRDARRNISVVFQNPYSSLNPRMRIIDIVGEPLLVLTDLDKDAIKQRVIDSLEAVGLSQEHLRRYPHAFSGGQRQRIAIARALVLEPKLIILDEPTAALDVSVQAQVVELLNELRARKKVAFLFITHDLALVERLANRVLVLYKGEIIERGTVEEVFQNPKHSYTKELLQSAPRYETFQENIHKS